MFKKKRVIIGIITIFCAIGMMQMFSTTDFDLQAESNETVQEFKENPLLDLDDLYIPNELKGLVTQSMQRYEEKARSVAANDKINEPIQIVNPVVFIEFKNANGTYDAEWLSDANLAKAEQLYNGSENSLRAYIKKLSYGKLDIVSEFYPKNSAGKVTSVKSAFYKSFLEPAAGASSCINGSNQLVPNINYDPAVGDNPGDPKSYRFHEMYVYKLALADTISTGGGVSVAQQIGNDYKGEYTYDMLNSRYFNIYDFSSLENDFYWNSKPMEGWTWPEFYRTNELVSADAFTFVLRATEAQVRPNGNKVSDIYWPHKYAWMDSGAPFSHLIDVPEGEVFPKTCSPNPNDRLCNISFTGINNAATVYADNNSGIFASTPNLGVITHEFMHVLGAPDLYRVSYKGQAVGGWDLMGAQNDTVPQFPLQFTNEKYGLWPTPEPEHVNSYNPIDSRSDLIVNSPAYTDSDEKTYYKIYPDTTDYVRHGEYFVVEYRKDIASGFDSQKPGDGLLIYRVNERISNTFNGAVCGIACGNMVGPPDEIFVYRPNAANASLSNQSAVDANLNNAAFPRTISGTKMNAIGKTLTEVPASNLPANFDKDTLYFSDGSNSGLRIVNISDTGGESMKFTVLYGDETVPDNSIKLNAAQASVVTRNANSITDNALTIVGGVAPYSFQVEAVEKNGIADDTSLFIIEDTNTSDTTGTLKLASGKTLEQATYTVKVNVRDSDNATKTITVSYQVKAALPTDASNLVFSDNNLMTSETASASAILGSLTLNGCSDDGCEIDYDCDYISYSIEFLADKDYSQYFQMHPILGSGSGMISIKKQIPAGTYPFKGVVTFVDGEDEVILANDTLELVVSEDTAIIYPTIEAPTGNILTATTWMKDVQVVSAIAKDTGNGLKSVTITTSDGMLVDSDDSEKKQIIKNYAQADKMTSDTLSFQIKANGTYTIQALNWDDNANQDAVSFTIDKLDCANPNITLQVTDVNNKQMATISTNDEVNGTTLSGIDANTIKYALVASNADESSITFTESYSAPFEVATNTAGKLCAEVYDHSGNRGQTCASIEKASDTQKPTLNASDITFSPDVWSNQNVTMSFNVEDNDSGVKTIKVESVDGALLDGSNQVKIITKTYDTPILSQNESFILSENGTFTITYEDASGNTDTTAITMKKIDKDLPIIDSLIISNDGANTSIDITAIDKPDQVDEQSGVKQIYYQHIAKDATTSASDWITYPDADTQNWTNVDDGSICAYAFDNAGNKSVESCKKFESSDNTKPTIDSIQGLKDITSDPTGWSNAATLEVSINASDSESGVKSVTVSKDGITIGTPFTATDQITSINYKCAVSENATYVVTVMDDDGNSESTSFTVNQFDRGIPVIDRLQSKTTSTFTLIPTGNKLELIAHDMPVGNHSGIDFYKYQFVVKGGAAPSVNIEDASWIRINDGDDFAVEPDFEGTLYAYAFDKVGNMSILFNETIKKAEETQLDTTLSSLTLSAGTLSPSFDKDVMTYSAIVENDIISLQVTATPTDGSATTTVSGNSALQVGSNEVKVVVTNGSDEATYTITVTRKAPPTAKDVTLKSLSISSGTLSPAFNKDVKAYSAIVENDITSLQVTAMPTDGDATTTVSGNSALQVGSNEVKIVVQNGSDEATYTITVTRKTLPTANDVTLNSLSISSGTLSPTFNKDIKAYSAIVENNVTSLQVTATPTDGDATTTVSGNSALQVGNNEVKIVVQKGSDEATYTIHVTRKTPPTANDVTLNSLSISSGTLSPTFNKDMKAYSAIVENNVTSLQVTATPTDGDATTTVSGNSALQVGNNEVKIVVQKGSDEATYTISVTRKATVSTTDVTLSSLSISEGTLSPVFNKTTTAYSATVENSVNAITISANPSDRNATVSGTGERTLSIGNNILSVMVKNGSEEKVYNVTVVRKAATSTTQSKDANLKNLSLSKGSLSPSFNATTYQYQVSVDYTVESIRAIAVANHAKAVVSGDIDKDISLKVGETTLKINVRAEDGTTKEYSILVKRKEQTTPSTSTEIVNKDNTIKVIGDLDQSLQLITKNLNTDQVQVKEEFHNEFVLEDVFDIYLTKEDGTKFTVNSDVKVRIALKDELKGKKNLLVVYIDDDGSVTNMPTTIYDDYVEFTTSHFSTYGIVSTKDTIQNVQTGDETSLMLWGSIAAFAFVCFTIVIRRKTRIQ